MPPKGEKRKQQIVDTAKVMFIERGFQSTHIGQVCDELNIARGTVYQYFSNKKEILIALFDMVVERIKDTLDTDELDEFAKQNRSTSEIQEFIKSRIVATVNVVLNEPIVTKLVFKDIQGMDDEVIAIVYQSAMRIKNVIVTAMKKLIELKVFREDVNAEVTALMLIGGVMTLIYEYGKRNEDVLAKDSVNAIVNIYLNGSFNKA
jgi:AcrR family transcriptional regulator